MEADTFLHQIHGLDHRVSFAVHDVKPATPVMRQISMSDSLETCMKSGDDSVPEVVAVCDTNGKYLELPAQNGLLAAVHIAFSQHLPLTLSPDMIWLAILQGFARHVALHAGRLERRLMLQPGKHTINVVVGHKEWTWPMVFDQFATALENHAGAWVRNLQADFSTTGPIERTASQVALMDVFSPYVQYVITCICGIPSITLTGNAADWERLREKLGLLGGYEADDWIEELDEVLSRFVDASRGEIDRAWWQQIYKLTPRYGGEDIEGWLGAFFPYLRDSRMTFTRRRVKGEKFATELVPPGLSDVRVKLQMLQGSDSLRIISGFVGVEDLGTDGVAPKIGWAVIRNAFMEHFAETLDRQPGIKTRPRPPQPEPESEPERNDRPEWNSLESLPVDLQLFYHATNGADLYGKGVIHSLETLLETERFGHQWSHLGAWNDGSLLLTSGAVVRLRWTGDEWEYQTLGTSFSDFVSRLTTAKGNEYWKDDAFAEPAIQPAWKEFQPPAPRDERLNASLEALRRQNRRLRSMKLVQHDVFEIRPPSCVSVDHLSAPLRWLYHACDGVVQAGGFELWPAARVAILPNTQSRWFEIGAAPGYRIIFDGVADRGVAVVATEGRRIHRIANSLVEFFGQVEREPQALYWEKPADWQDTSMPFRNVLWPDEKVVFAALPGE